MKKIIIGLMVLVFAVGVVHAMEPHRCVAREGCIVFLNKDDLVSDVMHTFEYGHKRGMFETFKKVRNGLAYILPSGIRVTVDQEAKIEGRWKIYHIIPPHNSPGWVISVSLVCGYGR